VTAAAADRSGGLKERKMAIHLTENAAKQIQAQLAKRGGLGLRSA
jgi:hypothetical protein